MMKKCPYCAEEIQDEAIVCRYCGRDIIPALTKIQTREGNTQSIEQKYERLFESLKQMDANGRNNYPLSINRRAPLIAKIIEALQKEAFYENRNQPNVALHISIGFYWKLSNPKIHDGFANWHDWGKNILRIQEIGVNYPTDDEWLTSIAYIIVDAKNFGLQADPSLLLDYIKMWKSWQKGKQWDRVIRGISLVGAIMNISRAFSPEKLPKEGTLEWQCCRHAYAQLEATLLQQMT